MFHLSTLLILCLIAITEISCVLDSDIEEFMHKLLMSDKLDELVDRIADRAVEKIKTDQRMVDNIQRNKPQRTENVLTGASRSSRPYSRPHSQPHSQERKHHNKEKPVDHDHRPSESKRHHESSFRHDEATSIKTPIIKRGVKIDNKAAREKFASFPFNKLSLKYKSFSTNNPSHAEQQTDKVKFSKDIGNERVRDGPNEKRSTLYDDKDLKHLSAEPLLKDVDEPQIDDARYHHKRHENREAFPRSHLSEDSEMPKNIYPESLYTTTQIEEINYEEANDEQTTLAEGSDMIVRREGSKLFAMKIEPEYRDYVEQRNKALLKGELIEDASV